MRNGGATIIRLSDGRYLGKQSRQVSWSSGVLPAPDAGEWHQHLSVGHAPSRYLTMSRGAYCYPFQPGKHVPGRVTRVKNRGAQ